MRSDDKEFERKVAAICTAAGLYVTRNLKTPGDKVTELDVIGQQLETVGVKRVLIECKNCKTGYRDVLYLSGRRGLVAADHSVLASSKNCHNDDDMGRLCRRTGSGLCDAITPETLSQLLSSYGFELVAIDASYIDAWLRWYQLEDALKAILEVERGDNRRPNCKAAYSYLFSLDCDLWWTYDNLFSRAYLSYDLHGRHRRIAQDVAVAYRAAGNTLDRNRHGYAVYADGKCPPGQAAFYVQTRARITFLALAAECAVCVLSDSSFRTTQCMSAKAQNQAGYPAFVSLVNELVKTSELAVLFPLFLQHWICLWGGFWLESAPSEKEVLGQEIGATITQIDSLLRLMDRALGGQWLVGITVDRKRVRCLKMMPEPMKGLGMEHREKVTGLRPWGPDSERWLNGPDVYRSRLRAHENGQSYEWQTIDGERKLE